MKLSILYSIVLAGICMNTGAYCLKGNASSVSEYSSTENVDNKMPKVGMTSQDGNQQMQDLEKPAEIDTVMVSRIDPFTILKGDLLRLFQITYDSFSKDKKIPSEKKNLEDYKIEFKQDEKYWYVYYGVSDERKEVLLKSRRLPRGGSTETTKDVLYIVRKQDYQLISRKFFK
jgi:hypothetical protein